MTNQKVKKALKENRVTQWRLADLMGISEFTLSKKFRYELPRKEQESMIALIKKEARERVDG